MYLPRQFSSTDPAHARDLMRGHPFASLITTDDEGFPFTTHLPLHLEDDGGPLRLLAMWPGPTRSGAICRRGPRRW